MKIRATRTFLNDVGMVRRGAEIDVRDVHAKSLIGRKLAVAVDEPAPAKRPAEPKKPKGAAASSQGE